MMADKRKKFKKILIFVLIILAIAIALFLIVKKTNLVKFLSDKFGSAEEETLPTDEYSIVGCIKYMDFYMYFDQDGILRFTSEIKDEKVPMVTGINIDEFVIGERLDISDEEIFRWLLEVVQSVGKYEIKLDKIYISPAGEMALFIDNVRIELGKNENTSEKLKELSNFYENLKALSGTLYMQDFDPSNKSFVFKSNV